MSSLSAVGPAARSIIYLGMDVRKDLITIEVLPADAKAATRLKRLPNDLATVTKWLDRLARHGELRACYEASGAGYVLHRALTEWGYAYEVIAPSLNPKRSGVQRKHDKRDAADLARLYRAGELVVVRIPSEPEERLSPVACAAGCPVDLAAGRRPAVRDDDAPRKVTPQREEDSHLRNAHGEHASERRWRTQ